MGTKRKILSQEEFDNEVKPRLDSRFDRLLKTCGEKKNTDELKPYQVFGLQSVVRRKIMEKYNVPSELIDFISNQDFAVRNILRAPKSG